MTPNYTSWRRNKREGRSPNLHNKHLVYKLWVSDCEIETGHNKKLKCYTNHPFPFNLLFGFTLNFFPLSLLKLICFKLGLSPVLFGTWLCSSTSCPPRYSNSLWMLHGIFFWNYLLTSINFIYTWLKCNNLSDGQFTVQQIGCGILDTVQKTRQF